ncbi:putative tyrosine-tRNA ligase 1 [Babesia sp. Xinjiang]|uniref:putative tyrosine-tRNA ligase 1 n=1 Tax=Babesia sp. Xinjiang TaxID=462227 RepID=UPI000A2467BE|nr:putative tyrosine-tRNA ligase 1 [Babesia sp. Xinjiang]ORM41485.1 putative tyrosine-tRNA ligase 1 [Babesia sp. Xinjiang]
MTRIIHSPLHGGLDFDASEDSHKTKTNFEFHTGSCAAKNAIRERLNAHFASSLSEPRIPVQEAIERCLKLSVECIKVEELQKLLERKDYVPICYDGFEPSGRMHIAQGICKAYKVNELKKMGIRSVMWIADWFAVLNDKLGGDMTNIRLVGEYFKHVWKAAGMDMDAVQFLWASEEINKNPDLYWRLVMDISRSFNITRFKRCSEALGRADGDNRPAASLLYPAMQCADIFYIGADICQLGLDQRKINMLAREYCELKSVGASPIILSHHMMPSLAQQGGKMSKSVPNSAIFIEDTEAEVNAKIKGAWCPEKEITDNPCIAYFDLIVFPMFKTVTIPRKPKNGGECNLQLIYDISGDVTYETQQQLEEDYKTGKLHPADLKPALAGYINQLLQPVRDYFQNNPEASELARRVAELQKLKTQHDEQGQ